MMDRLGAVFSGAVGTAMTVPGIVWAQSGERGYGYGYGHMWGGGGWGHFFLGPLMMILVIAAIVAVVVLLVRWIGGAAHGGGASGPPPRRALDILEERYARGEIDRDDYLQKRNDLA